MQNEVISERVAFLKAKISETAVLSGRCADSVKLIAVTKTHPVEMVRAALAAGVVDVGENRVQEALPKIQAEPAARYHLIGHLQSNKARAAVEHFALIHSLDSVRLAKALNEQAHRLSKQCHVLLQVNVSGEDSKSGFEPEEIRAAIAEIMETCPALVVDGFMTMAPLVIDAEATRPHFHRLREMARELREETAAKGWKIGPELSMGMTNDYEVAIEEGATMVRIGSAIFGNRPKH